MGKFIEDQRKKHDTGLCEMMLNVQKNAQRTKLEAAREHGRVGWETANPADIEMMMAKAHNEGDWISVANYAGMLYLHSLAESTDVLAGPHDTRQTGGQWPHNKGVGTLPHRRG